MASRVKDSCPVCGHYLEAFDRAWERMKSSWGLVICANYCTAKTCGVKGCKHECAKEVEATEGVFARVLSTMQRRKARHEG